MFRDLANAIARDALDHVLAVRNNDGNVLAVPASVALHADETRGRELIDLRSRFRVQMQGYAEPFIPSLLTPS